MLGPTVVCFCNCVHEQQKARNESALLQHRGKDCLEREIKKNVIQHGEPQKNIRPSERNQHKWLRIGKSLETKWISSCLGLGGKGRERVLGFLLL